MHFLSFIYSKDFFPAIGPANLSWLRQGQLDKKKLFSVWVPLHNQIFSNSKMYSIDLKLKGVYLLIASLIDYI